MASKKHVIALLIALTTGGCSAALYVPSLSDVSPQASLPELNAGRELYAGRCGSCHTLQLPERFQENEWKQHLDKMRQRARLTDREYELVRKYLAVGSRSARTGPS